MQEVILYGKKIMKKGKIALLICILILICSCDKERLRPGNPIGADLMSEAPPGPEAFRAGWKDGCDSAIGATFGTFHKMQYGFKMNYELFSKDPDYNIGRTEATWFCGRYGERYNNLGETG